jgi:hypothetical protein
MRNSDLWYYTIMVLVIGHLVAGFVFLIIKLSPKKKDKENNNEKE